MKEFLLSDEFSKYRRKQIEEIIGHATPDLLNPTNENLPLMVGALNMAAKLLKLPVKMTKDRETKKLLQAMYSEDIKRFEIGFVRVFLETGEEDET